MIINPMKKPVKESDSKQSECKRCKWLRGKTNWIGSPPLCDRHGGHQRSRMGLSIKPKALNTLKYTTI